MGATGQAGGLDMVFQTKTKYKLPEIKVKGKKKN